MYFNKTISITLRFLIIVGTFIYHLMKHTKTSSGGHRIITSSHWSQQSAESCPINALENVWAWLLYNFFYTDIKIHTKVRIISLVEEDFIFDFLHHNIPWVNRSSTAHQWCQNSISGKHISLSGKLQRWQENKIQKQNMTNPTACKYTQS